MQLIARFYLLLQASVDRLSVTFAISEDNVEGNRSESCSVEASKEEGSTIAVKSTTDMQRMSIAGLYLKMK